MQTIHGKYNFAHVMIDTIDDSTREQIQGFLDIPVFKNTYIAIMPDCHAGKGSCIGFTAKFGNHVIPNIVGVDIGCGMLAKNIGRMEIDYDMFDSLIREFIPAGFNIHNKNPWIDQIEDNVISQFQDVAKKIGQNPDKTLNSIGTLGGGNHFIEIDEDIYLNKWIVIHSGSRNFGARIADYHQKKAKALMASVFQNDFSNCEFLPIEHGGQEYLEDMKLAQLYASHNRKTMMDILLKKLNAQFVKDTIECVHNYINFDDNIIRKGAISAHQDERVLIPLNMRDGVIVGKGKGSKKWNYSAPHGAGRLMSRTQAKEVLDMGEFEKSMDGIWTSCINLSTLEESPYAYKNKDDIINAIGETVSIDFIMKPVYNFKDSKKDSEKVSSIEE